MSITLYWWMVPLTIAGIGFYTMTRPTRGWTDLGNGVAGCLLLVLAVALWIGYLWGAR